MTLPHIDKLALVAKLDPIELEKAAGREVEQLEALSLARALRTVATLQAEQAYSLCREMAERSLGRVPEPEPPIQD